MKKNNKKKLLIFHPALAPYRVDFFNELGKHFDCKIIFLTRNNYNQSFDQKELLRGATYQIGYLDKHLRVFKRNINFGYIIAIKKYTPDIVISSEYGLSTCICTLYKHFGHYKIYSICDDSYDIVIKCKGIRKILRSIFTRLLDGLITCNENVKNWYITHSKIKQVINFPIIRDERVFEKNEETINIIASQYISNYHLNQFKIGLFIGRMTPVKNLKALIECFSEVKKNNYKLILIGDGQQREELTELIEERKLCNFILLPGRFEGNKLLAWYKTADFFILPSIFEPFGAVTNEALLSGCRVLVSKFAGSSCLVNGNNGRVFDPTNKEEFKEVLSDFYHSSKLTDTNIRSKDNKMSYLFENQIKELILTINEKSISYYNPF